MQRRDENPAAFLIPIFTPLAWVLVGYPVLGWLWAQWTGDKTYAYGVPVFLLALYLGWRLWPRGVQWQGHDVGLVALGLLVLAYIWVSGRGIRVAAAALWVGVGAAMVWAVAGQQTLRRVWPSFVLILTAIPWPPATQVGSALGRGIAAWVTTVAQRLGFPASAREGEVLWRAGQPLVDAGREAGWLLATLFALAVVLALLLDGPWTVRLALPAVALPWAVAVTAGRVILSLLLASWLAGPAPLAFELVLDWATLAVAAGVLILFAWRGGCERVRPEVLGRTKQ